MFKAASIFIVAATASLAIPVLPTVAQEASAPVIQNLCTGMGFEPGQLEFLYCTESLRESAGNLPLSHRSGYYAEAAPMNGERYFAETGFYGGNRLVSERGACAGIGLPPDSQAFRQCVGNLDASMWEIRNSRLGE